MKKQTILLPLILLPMALTACVTPQERQGQLMRQAVSQCESYGFARGTDRNFQCSQNLFAQNMANDRQRTANFVNTMNTNNQIMNNNNNNNNGYFKHHQR